MRCSVFSYRAAPLAVLLAAGAVWSAAAPSSGFAEYEMQTTTRTGKTGTTSLKMWFTGQKMRQEVSVQGGTYVTLLLPGESYVMPPGSKEATRYSMPGQMRAGTPGTFGDIERIKKYGKKVGTETVGEYKTVIYEESMKMG